MYRRVASFFTLDADRKVARDEVIPEVGERSPESGFTPPVNPRERQKAGRNLNKNEEFLRWSLDMELARHVHLLGTPLLMGHDW